MLATDQVYRKMMMVTVTQSADDFGGIDRLKRLIAEQKKNAAFDEWRIKLDANDTLPQGKFFKGKKPGNPVMIIDEAHLFIGRS